MRFAAVTLALFAGLVAALPNGAESTVYQTEEVTITSCAPTVTNCPGNASGATSAPAITTSVPAGGVSPVGSSSGSSVPVVVSSSVSSSVSAPGVPSVTVVPVVYTTCAAVTSWSTVAVPPASTPAASSVPSSVSPVR